MEQNITLNALGAKEINQMFDEIQGVIELSDTEAINENANLDGKTTAAKQHIIQGIVMKYQGMQMLSPRVRTAFKEGAIHIHDFDFYVMGTTTCTHIPFDQIMKGGFNIGDGSEREPNHIGTAMIQSAIIFGANQNTQHGGQASANFDFEMAPYVEKEFKRQLREARIELSQMSEYHNHSTGEIVKVNPEDIETLAMKIADEKTKELTLQACEGFVHNMNSMNVSRGNQTVFCSGNIGLDTSKFGQIFTDALLEAIKNGIGNNNEMATYPILILKLKKGINRDPQDPNYWLFRKALSITPKRLFPNYLNCDASFNKNESGDLRKEIATMGCRTRVFEDVNGECGPVGRGNNSFTTLNLPMLAMQAKKENRDFFDVVMEHTDLAIQQLHERYNWQCKQLMSSARFMWENETQNMHGRKFEPEKEVGDLLKHGTQAVGFIGLAEALMIYKPELDYISDEAQEIGYSLISQMKDKTDAYTKKTSLNFGVIATPAEGYSRKSMAAYKAKYGTEGIESIKDNEFFTNSNHVPVWVDVDAKTKIDIEAKYHNLTRGGHILYIELTNNSSHDIDGLEAAIQYACENNAGYISGNGKPDQCLNCGYDGAIEHGECPVCGNTNISRVRRITGYISKSIDRWNSGKQDEESKRVTHDLTSVKEWYNNEFRK